MVTRGSLIIITIITTVALIHGTSANCSESSEYMCANVGECWDQLGFSSEQELADACGVVSGGGGGGGGSAPPATITDPPRSITVPLLASARFSCSASNAAKVVIVPEDQADQNNKIDSAVAGRTQTVIQEIDSVLEEHEGWYVCIAWGADGSMAQERAYLEIRDICAEASCPPPKECQPDMYTGEYECVCPGDCSKDFDPVCGSNCQSYFNECTMKKETCESGEEGVFVKSKGFCPTDCTVEVNVKEPDTQCCKVYGDPHIITFDQAKYDYMGSCTYVIAQDKNMGKWMVYGKFTKCGDPTKQLSCIVSITVFYGPDMIQFLRGYRINYNGEDFKLGMGESRRVGDILVENNKMKYFATLGDTGVVVSWDGIITSQVCLPKKCMKGVEGLCSNADCDDTNEYDNAGTIVRSTGTFKALTSSEFGNSWAVDPTGCDFEEGYLSEQVERDPCDGITAWMARAYENRCKALLGNSFFSNCAAQTTIDFDAALANCIYDSCSGLVYGLGCKDNDPEQCRAEQIAELEAARDKGYTAKKVMKIFTSKVHDPTCMMGLTLAQDCASWGVFIGDGWREEMNCPSDEELAGIQICP